jgi:hypothetical protein
MQPIRILVFWAILASTSAAAETDPACLKHLGGAFYGVECYNGLGNDLRKSNSELKTRLLKIIPRNNPNVARLNRYLRNLDEAMKTCEITSESMNSWRPAEHAANPRYVDTDVLFYECKYRLLKHQNEFLNSLLSHSE